jgi:two-component system, cell cycle response regulator
MGPLVRLTVHLQQVFLRLAGLLLAAALGLYLIAWAADPPPNVCTAMAAGVLLLSTTWHMAAHARGRQESHVTQVDLGLFTSLTVLVFAAILQLPGGLDGGFYPLIYVLVMASAAYSRPTSAVVTVVFAGSLELGLRTIALGQADLTTLGPRLGFLVLFAGLNVGLFRAEIARVRRISRKHVRGELERLREAARSYRLSGGHFPAGEEHAVQSAVGEVQQATHYALTLLHDTMRLSSVVLLTVGQKDKIEIFEAITNRTLVERPLHTREGVFGAALTQRAPITLSGRRAAHHAAIYAEPQVVGALAVVPIFEKEKPRALLFVDREEEKPFTTEEIGTLCGAGEFILRAVQNERVYAQLERASREQSKLYRAAESLNSAVTEAQVIEIGVESAREVASFDFAAVTLFHRKTAVHEICAVSGAGADKLVGRTFRHNAGLVSMVVANRQALPYRGEYEPSRQTVFARGYEPPPMPSLLVLPLLVHEHVLGTLVLGSTEKHAFRENVRPALEVLSSHMAVSLSNARMLKRLEEQATTDGMTGLLNKRTLISEAERRIKVAERFKKPLSLLVCDIDHFKNVNDTYGHDVGDVVIKGLGEVLRRIKRDTDSVGRFGGEEFVILCEQTDEEGAHNFAERLRSELEATTFQTELGPLKVTCSVGVAPFPLAGRDWPSLFKATDEALYASKRGGRNRVTVWRPNLKTSAA